MHPKGIYFGLRECIRLQKERYRIHILGAREIYAFEDAYVKSFFCERSTLGIRYVSLTIQTNCPCACPNNATSTRINPHKELDAGRALASDVLLLVLAAMIPISCLRCNRGNFPALKAMLGSKARWKLLP
jgi:hypothetical protein